MGKTKQDLFIYTLINNGGKLTTREMMDLIGESVDMVRQLGLNCFRRGLIYKPEIIKSDKKPYRILKYKICKRREDKIKEICSKF